MDTVSMPMYDLPEVREATDALRRAIAESLTDVGWAAEASNDAPATHADLLAHWRSPSLALSHSCGLPVIEHLGGHVTVVGTFRWSGISDGLGRYRSLIVVPASCPASSLRDLAATTAAVNDTTSLSGWCSLGAALAGAASEPARSGMTPRLVVTGSHAASLDAVRRGAADVAAIDPATFALLARHRPGAVDGVRVLGVGPTVPATPLVTRRDAPIGLDAVRGAVRRAVDGLDPVHRDTLGIDGFVTMTDADYEPVRALAVRADGALPRADPLFR